MSTSQLQPFQARVRRIERRHNRMTANGAAPKLEKDGLIVMRPKRALPRPGLRSVLLIAVFAFGFKVFTYSALGPDAYGDRLAALTGGDAVRQAGAFVMQPDPATVWVHGRLMELRALTTGG